MQATKSYMTPQNTHIKFTNSRMEKENNWGLKFKTKM